jgi:hypothetical protein
VFSWEGFLISVSPHGREGRRSDDPVVPSPPDQVIE